MWFVYFVVLLSKWSIQEKVVYWAETMIDQLINRKIPNNVSVVRTQCLWIRQNSSCTVLVFFGVSTSLVLVWSNTYKTKKWHPGILKVNTQLKVVSLMLLFFLDCLLQLLRLLLEIKKIQTGWNGWTECWGMYYNCAGQWLENNKRIAL